MLTAVAQPATHNPSYSGAPIERYAAAEAAVSVSINQESICCAARLLGRGLGLGVDLLRGAPSGAPPGERGHTHE